MHRFARFAAGFGVLVLFFGMVPSGASAHEHRDVADGQYSLVVGFLDEPAFTGEKNGLDLRVAKHDPAAAGAETTEGEEAVEEEGTPVVGLEDTLKAEVIYGDQKMELTLEPRFQAPGAYDAHFFPTAAGDYTFRIYGDIEGAAIDETFTSSPEGFSSVQAREDLEFPKAS
jgi:hypothetical protein